MCISDVSRSSAHRGHHRQRRHTVALNQYSNARTDNNMSRWLSTIFFVVVAIFFVCLFVVCLLVRFLSFGCYLVCSFVRSADSTKPDAIIIFLRTISRSDSISFSKIFMMVTMQTVLVGNSLKRTRRKGIVMQSSREWYINNPLGWLFGVSPFR